MRTILLLLVLLATTTAYPQPADTHTADKQAAQRQALGFLNYLDQGRYNDSYEYTGMLIRNQVDRPTFTQQIEKARTGVGAMQQRSITDVTYSTTVPGAPQGQYVVLHYQTAFANRQDAVETLTLDFNKGYWRLAGYYLR